MLYTWKALNGLVPDFGLEPLPRQSRRGNLLKIPSLTGPPGRLRTLREGSLQVEGPTLYNSLPPLLRDLNVDLDTFKVLLDMYLQEVPDHPRGHDDMPGTLSPN